MSYLTIGIPTYNGAFNFTDLIGSISKLGLKEEEYEILIIDNASADDTLQVVENLQKTIPNLRFYRNEKNIGRIQNWNKVIEVSKGTYLILMNVNDRFVNFDTKTYLNYLDKNPEMSLVMSDIINIYPDATYNYPEWNESGIFKFQPYIRETFLNQDIVEFYSLGVLHQHIYRLETIKKHNIKFDDQIPRTTDRVFVAEVICKGNFSFYYTAKPMVTWVSNDKRFHFAAEQNLKSFDFNALWINEYKANLALATMADISLKDFLQSQAIRAKYLDYTFKLKRTVNKVYTKNAPPKLEEVTALAYYYYILAQCQVNNIQLDLLKINAIALNKKIKKPLRRFKLLKKANRTMFKAM